MDRMGNRDSIYGLGKPRSLALIQKKYLELGAKVGVNQRSFLGLDWVSS